LDVFESSYDALVSLVQPIRPGLHIVDLGCGDGHLLQRLLAAAGGQQLILTGIDFSVAEVAAARRVLPSSVRLLNEAAQAISLKNGEADYVLSHMALMLMHDIDTVLAEIARVLKPGGTLGAMLGRRFMLGEANDIYRGLLKPYVAAAGNQPLSAGSARAVEEWQALLEPSFDEIEFEDTNVPWRPTPSQLCESLKYSYDVDRLSLDAAAQLQTELLLAFNTIALVDGTIDTGWGFRRLRARRRQDFVAR
jgi:ubiquinone/menaquinone biosynthesis C-methylase UbiE